MSHHPVSRREMLLLSLAGLGAAGASPASAQEAGKKFESGIAWYNVQDWGVEGKGWSDTTRYFDRLPARAQGKVRDAVWNLSRHSAGMAVRFETDTREIRCRYSLLSASLAMPHMPATGVSGVDLYAQDHDGKSRWVGVARPAAQKVVATLGTDLDPAPNGTRVFTAYLPLYNGTDSLEIGVPEGARFTGLKPREKPVLFYGTSIMHGACASRPGMAMTAILERRFNRPMLNLGFSGNGQMETEVVAFLTELDPAAYVIDCLPNMTPEMVAARTEPLVRQLRAARPTTPILLVEDRTFTNARFNKAARDAHAARRKALRTAFDHLRSAGDSHLAYLGGEALLGDDGEAATDGSHPNDLGMVRYADAYEKVLKRLL
jgi:lysophospholipase L1-like esterase